MTDEPHLTLHPGGAVRTSRGATSLLAYDKTLVDWTEEVAWKCVGTSINKGWAPPVGRGLGAWAGRGGVPARGILVWEGGYPPPRGVGGGKMSQLSAPPRALTPETPGEGGGPPPNPSFERAHGYLIIVLFCTE
jgi:hypothetical protein